MIFGIGTDILDASRIDVIVKKFNKKFISRIYGQNEISFLDKKLKNKNLILAFKSYYERRFKNIS